MKRLFVTGASGFIGSNLVRLALTRDISVAILAEPGDSLSRLADVRDKLEVVTGSFMECEAWSDAVQQWSPDACVHLAWYVRPSDYLTSPNNMDCLKGSLDLLRVLGRVGCRQVAMAGTCVEYRFGEDPLAENGPTEATTLYAACKLALSEVARQWASDNGMRLTWARIFFLYGPYENPGRLVPAAIDALLAGREFACSPGDQIRDYLYVEDVAGGLLTLVEKEAQGICNICSGERTSVREILQEIGRQTGRTDLLRFGAKAPREGEPSVILGQPKQLRSLGWKPAYSLKAGLSRTIEWWRRTKGLGVE